MTILILIPCWKSKKKKKKELQKLWSTFTARLKSKPFITVVNQWNRVANNRYTQLTLTPADCHKHFQLKLMLGEHI